MDYISIFAMGFLWFFMISMQTRIVSHTNNYVVHGVWTFLVSVVWAYLIKNVTEAILSKSDILLILYALGTAVGSILATAIHARIKRNKGKIS